MIHGKFECYFFTGCLFCWTLGPNYKKKSCYIEPVRTKRNFKITLTSHPRHHGDPWYWLMPDLTWIALDGTMEVLSGGCACPEIKNVMSTSELKKMKILEKKRPWRAAPPLAKLSARLPRTRGWPL